MTGNLHQTIVRTTFLIESEMKKKFLSIENGKLFNYHFSHLILELPIWNYDGSSTGQAKGKNSDTYLYPVALYRDPFRRGDNKLVLCDTYKYNKLPTESNHRKTCNEVMER